MFEGPYREREAPTIEIPNIAWDVFEAMMRYVYAGQVSAPCTCSCLPLGRPTCDHGTAPRSTQQSTSEAGSPQAGKRACLGVAVIFLCAFSCANPLVPAARPARTLSINRCAPALTRSHRAAACLLPTCCDYPRTRWTSHCTSPALCCRRRTSTCWRALRTSARTPLYRWALEGLAGASAEA